MAPKIVDKEEKRARIAHAAVEVFGERGFDRTRMEDVARAAGVGKGTLYEYFADKEQLLQGAFAGMMEHYVDEFEPEVDASCPPLETLEEMCTAMVRAMSQMGPVYRFFLEYMLHRSRTGAEYPFLRQMLGHFRSLVSGLLSAGIADGSVRDDIDPEAVAAAYVAWFDGAIFHWIVLPGSVSLEEMARTYHRTMLHGIARRNCGDRAPRPATRGVAR